MRFVLVAGLAALLASCGSPPTTFYTLSPVPPAARRAASAPGCTAHPIVVERVDIPAMLDREALVSESGPGRVAISGDRRWAGPLDGMIQHVIADDLRTRLAPGAVLAPGDPAPASGARGLQVNILRFMPNANGVVMLGADWSLLDRKGYPLLTRSESISESGGADPGAAVAAMSRALAGLADRIAAGVPACSDSRAAAR